MSKVMTPRRKRLILLLLAGALLVAAGLFVKQAFRSNLVFFVTPGELATDGAARSKELLRVGGLVQPGSVHRAADGGLEVRFTLADATSAVPVVYRGVLPDLFVEGKGAIAQGKLDDSGTLIATEVLAKHDENYMPPKVQEALKGGQPMQKAAQ
ncbi:MAG: cytochrome c maturation protein CcmE [Betaproteobacteria bacterium]|nr:cytochrome c maturation protein CcmE [Betaproteobacteria bacterium]